MSHEAPCPRRDKWFRGCRFEPRYDVGAPDMTGVGRVRFADAEDAGPFYEALKPKTYLHDICVVCGKVVAPEIHNEHDSPAHAVGTP